MVTQMKNQLDSFFHSLNDEDILEVERCLIVFASGGEPDMSHRLEALYEEVRNLRLDGKSYNLTNFYADVKEEAYRRYISYLCKKGD